MVLSGKRPLNGLNGRALGGTLLRMELPGPALPGGWRGFSLWLETPGGRRTREPVVQGVYRPGEGEGGLLSLDIQYSQTVPLPRGEERLDLQLTGVEEGLFQLLGGCVAPGGSLLVSCDGRDAVHEETHAALLLGIPPLLTPIGRLVRIAGFPWIKDWRWIRGGHEGPRKLWGEKPSRKEETALWNERLAAQLLEFLLRIDRKGRSALEENAREEARSFLKSLAGKGEDRISQLVRVMECS